MFALALRSLRHRRAAFTATFATALLGTAMIASFAGLFQASFHGDVVDADADALRIMAVVIGAWGALIVLFSIVSTVGIVTRQRAEEFGLLRVIGATTRQARRLAWVEASVVTALGVIGGVAIAWPAGGALLALIGRSGLVERGIDYGTPWIAFGAAAGLVSSTSLLATTIAARRANRGSATLSLRLARSDGSRMRWWRVVLGSLLIAYGLVLGIITITVTANHDDPYAAMSTSGSSSILVGIGLATLSPLLLRGAALLLSRIVRRPDAPGWLAATTVSRRSDVLSGVLGPVIVLVAASVGTLMLVGIDRRTVADGHPDSGTITLLNNLVTGMIVLFAAIMVVNSFAAAVAARCQEFRRLRLIGATDFEIGRSVLTEAGVVAAVGAVFGLLASSATVVPFAVAREEGVVPNGQLWLPPLAVVAAVAVTMFSARAAIGRDRPARTTTGRVG